MVNDIEGIDSALKSAGLDAVHRSADHAAWGQVWSALPYQGTAYQAQTIDYQHAYLKSCGWDIRDAGLVLLHDGRPCGIWPLTVGQMNGSWNISSCGAAIQPPMFLTALSDRTIKNLCGRAINFLKIACMGSNCLSPLIEQNIIPDSSLHGATEWHQQLLLAGATIFLKHDMYVDLRYSLGDIRAGFRKSFRALINSGQRHWSVFTLDRHNAAEAVWAEFRQLHRTAAGRATRSDETWAMQFDMLRTGHAFLIGIRDPADQRMVGGGFFQHTRDEGLYAVGAYDRLLFDKPIGHVVQQRAIETMKDLGLSWYRIGERHYEQDQPPPSGKEVAISQFKQGFASHLMPRFQFALPLEVEGAGTSEE